MLVKDINAVFIVAMFLIFTSRVYTFSPLDSTNHSSHSSSSYELKSFPSAKLPSLFEAAVSGIIESVIDRIVNGMVATIENQTPGRTCTCSCGVKNYMYYSSRIVGGQQATPHSYPWMAQLSYFGQFFCGGSLINDRYVLTAAHCADRWWPRWIQVTLGNHNRCDTTKRRWSSYVTSVVSPAFSFAPIYGTDIALLRLRDRAPMNQYIQPICLPEAAYDYADMYGTAAGWGTTSENGKSSCTLRDVNIPIMSNHDCFVNSDYKNISSVLNTSNMICAAYKDGGADTCQGDSGGPLMVERGDGRHVIVGVVSWGIGCARPNKPGIYTRVTKHLNWIRTNSRGGCSCRD